MHPSTIIFPSPFLPVNFLSSFRPNFSNENKTNESWLFRREDYPWLKWYPIRRNLNFSKVCLATFFFLTFSTFNAFIGRFVFVHPWIFESDLDPVFFHCLFHNYYKSHVFLNTKRKRVDIVTHIVIIVITKHSTLGIGAFCVCSQKSLPYIYIYIYNA